MNNNSGQPPWEDVPPEVPAEEQERLREKCRTDILFWINEYGTTYDPRKRQPHLRFKLFPYQKRLVKTLVEKIRRGEDILIEKSRDMGVSWLVLLVFQWFWLFEPGSDFLLGSRKSDYVDRLGDMSTLMEKLRYNLDRQPRWLLPQGFNNRHHNTLLKLINPQNGNTITGESSNPNFARGGRYKGILFDEFAYWQRDDLAWASAGQSSPCRIAVSTPHGRANKFAQLRFESPIGVESIHWRLHPEKNDAWYANEKKRMTEDEIARELDINYHLSARDRVFREFTHHHKRDIAWNPHQPVVRSWDFGYHTPAVLFLQIDPFGRMLVLHEIVGERVQFKKFAAGVVEESEHHFPGATFEDYADPAGAHRSDKSELTNLELLAQMGIYPAVKTHTVFDEIEMLRNAFADCIEGLPGLIVHTGCHTTIAALEGGYRYNPNTDRIIEEHPYEDVMDCLRYAASHKLELVKRRTKPVRPRYQIRPQDPYTNY